MIVLPLVGFGRAVRRRSRAAQDTLADASAYAAELIGAVRTLQAFTNEPLASGALRRRGRARLSRRDPVDQGARGAHRDHHFSRLRERRRHPLGRRAGRDRGRDDARPAQPVRAVRGVRGERARPIERGLGRAVAGRGLGRAADGAARDRAAKSSAPAHPVALPPARRAPRSRSRRCALPIRRGRRPTCSTACRFASSPARRSRSSAPPAPARARSFI